MPPNDFLLSGSDVLNNICFYRSTKVNIPKIRLIGNPLNRLSVEELKELEALINDHHEAVQVNSMDLVTKKCIKRLKEGEDSKRKRYTALCTTGQKYDLEKLKGRITRYSMFDVRQVKSDYFNFSSI